MEKPREWLFYNAVMAWLVNYASKGDPDLVKQYQDLLKKLDNEQFIQLKHKNADVRRKDKGRKKPQAIRQARKRTKQLLRRLK